jgi:hypothetical protein
MPSVDLRLWDGGHLDPYRHEEEILAGFDDHVATPILEHTPDGVQLAYGPRVPLLMFGDRVPRALDSRWNAHSSIGRTVLELLGLPPPGVPQLDDALDLADLVAGSARAPSACARG